MEEETFGQSVKRTAKKTFRIIVVLLLLVGGGVFSFYYWATYEEGVMSGKVMRISKRGMIFKTYEGRLNLEAFGALKEASPLAESFDFSVEKDETELIKELEEMSLSGERINMHFKKRYGIFPWRGKTRYFATSVDRLNP
jgi:hypothetical protein